MEDDFLRELGYLALATRMKRLSDRMIHSGRQMYKTLHLDIEPNWYMVFLLLEKKGPLTVTTIASSLQFSHPSVISILDKMNKQGYLHMKKSELDGRKQLASLSEKALNILPQLKSIWDAGTFGMEQMMGSEDLLTTLSLMEENLKSMDFEARTIQHLKKH